MADSASSFLAPWSSFYIMTGSAAASLTGLTFVVVTLVRRAEATQATQDGLAVFSTPTVIHFAVALFISAVLIAPWHSMVPPAIQIALAGLFGVAYLSNVIYRQRRLTIYTADLEDWIWYSIVPMLTYLTLIGGAIALPSRPVTALFIIAGTVVLQIFIGIRNAWDVVTFLAMGRADNLPDPSSKDENKKS